MITLIDDLLARLAPLGPTIPVLRPEDIELPLTGRKPGQVGGLSAYLAAHPEGYVQLETPTPITDDGTTGTLWVTVGAVASEQAAALALAQRVRLLLCGTPRDPGRYLPIIPAAAERLPSGAYLARPTFSIVTVDGVLAV